MQGGGGHYQQIHAAFGDGCDVIARERTFIELAAGRDGETDGRKWVTKLTPKNNDAAT